LRDLIDARGVPPALMQRPKQGFNPPLDRKIAVLGGDFFLNELGKGAVSSVLDPDAMRHTVQRHFSGQANETYRLWQLLYFNYWLEGLKSFRAAQNLAA
jgi:asparagine synthase (glutamine-hydrolysing)